MLAEPFSPNRPGGCTDTTIASARIFVRSREALLLLLLAAVKVAAFLVMRSKRPAMPVAIAAPSFWWKPTNLGVIEVVGAGAEIRSGRPTAAWGAFVFACLSDDPLDIAVCYVLGCSIVAILGQTILLRLSRWWRCGFRPCTPPRDRLQ
jgi:hypothetical protein